MAEDISAEVSSAGPGDRGGLNGLKPHTANGNGSLIPDAGMMADEDTPLFSSGARAHEKESGEMLVQDVAIDPGLAGTKVLVVDDDIRNVFAITTVLEEAGMAVESAETGQAAIDKLEEMPDMEVVLMDIMMPGMDGYETIRAIREFAAFRPLPIIAVTARAMPGDREKCLEAGASDYISKPIQPGQLLTMLAKWAIRCPT
jgi:CheY-like chemotaxis protein